MLPEQKQRYPRRPPRLDRLFANSRPFYFVTFNTYARLPLLARDVVAEGPNLVAGWAQRVLAVEHRLLVDTLAGLAAEGLSGFASASMTDRSRSIGAD